MRNRFADICFRCGIMVAAGAGHFERVSRTTYEKYGWQQRKWLTQHAECAIKYRGTDAHYLKRPELTKEKS